MNPLLTALMRKIETKGKEKIERLKSVSLWYNYVKPKGMIQMDIFYNHYRIVCCFGISGEKVLKVNSFNSQKIILLFC